MLLDKVWDESLCFGYGQRKSATLHARHSIDKRQRAQRIYNTEKEEGELDHGVGCFVKNVVSYVYEQER
jgi:hypothetical protein